MSAPISPPSKLRRLALGLFVAFGVLLLAEALLRLAHYKNIPPEVPIIEWNADEDLMMKKEDYLFRSDELALWTPRPGARVEYGLPGEREEPELINAATCRGPSIELARKPGVLRLATMGDSSTFGVGNRYATTYSAQLERVLQKRGRPAEVLDAGVDGYTIVQGLARYRSLVRAHHPDVLVAAFGAVNEHWGALDLADEDKVRQNQERKRIVYHVRRFVLEHSRIAQWIHELLHPNFMRELRESVIHRRDEMEAMAEESATANFKGVRRVSIERFKELLSTLVNEARADGTRVILMANPRRAAAEEQFPVLVDYSRAVLEIAAMLQVQVLDERERWIAFEGLGANEDELFIADFWHPNPTGHAKIAADLAELVLDPSSSVGRDPKSR